MKGEGVISVTRERWDQLRVAEDERDKIEAAARSALKRFVAWRDLNVVCGYHECGSHEGLKAGIECLEEALMDKAEKRPPIGTVRFLTMCACTRVEKDVELADAINVPIITGGKRSMRRFNYKYFDRFSKVHVYNEEVL